MSVTAVELARRLGVDPKRFRAWLRHRAAGGHSLLAGHQHNDPWVFTVAEADQLASDYRGHAPRPRRSASGRPPNSQRMPQTSTPPRTASPSARTDGAHVGHRVVEEWMGERVETLADLLRPGLRAVCVGINPSPVSVAAGHYYQGTAGQRFFGRLQAARVLPGGFDGYEDDAAFAAGVGFTDIIKRPTDRAKGLPASEYAHGRELLVAKLERYEPELVIFTFKKTAQAVLGNFAGNGFVPGLSLAGTDVFVMPGPYESAASADATLRTLARRF